MKNTSLWYSLVMFAGFTLFFLVMTALGYGDNYNLRIFNSIIHLGMIYLAIRSYREKSPESAGNYLSGVAVGMYSSILAVVAFSAFLFIYLTADPVLMDQIRASVPTGEYLNPFTATLFITVEGIAVSLIGSYILTRIIDSRMSTGKYSIADRE